MHNRKKIPCVFGDLWYLVYMKNEMNQVMTKKEFNAFGDAKDWNLSEYVAYNEGYTDENNNPYEEGTLAHYLYEAGIYEYHTNN